MSPDIIIRQRPVANPQALFGLGSGNENSDSLSEEILPGQDSFIYFRVFNTGGSDAHDVTLDLSAVAPTTFVDQLSRTFHQIGSVTIPHVSQDKMTVAGPINWLGSDKHIPGQSCTVVTLGQSDFIRSIFSIPDPSAQGSVASHIFPFVIAGDGYFTRNMTIQTFGSLPPASNVALQIPLDLAQKFKANFTAT